MYRKWNTGIIPESISRTVTTMSHFNFRSEPKVEFKLTLEAVALQFALVMPKYQLQLPLC